MTLWHEEWQWFNGSGTIRQIRSIRFDWYKFQSGSGSIKRDIEVLYKESGSGWVAVAVFLAVAHSIVAVAGWQWYQSTDKINAVILVHFFFGAGWQWLGGSTLFYSPILI
jgi:hypothetical protein